MLKRGMVPMFLLATSLCVAHGPTKTFVCTAVAAQAPDETPRHDFFRVSLGDSFTGPVSGRLLLFIAPGAGDAKEATSVDLDMMSPTSVYVVAKEVQHLAPGESVDMDADDVVFPAAPRPSIGGQLSGAGGSRCSP